MKILVCYYSRKGYTEKLANIIQKELASRGHEIEVEVIKPAKRVYGYSNLSSNWFVLMCQTLPGVPYILFSCWVKRLKRYFQFEVNIEPLQYPDVSGFDRVIVGGPKWTHLCFPVARYLKQVKGLAGKKVGGFTCLCGAPLVNFEIYGYFFPFNKLVRKAGGEIIAQLVISSGCTDVLLLPTPWFKMLSRLIFRKPLSYFAIDSEWGKQQTKHFCDLVEKEEVSPEELLLPQ